MKCERLFPFECNLCVLNFATRLERNEHTKLHFKQKYCISCEQSLIQIGDEWYELRLHSDEKCFPVAVNDDDDDVKSEPQSINPFEVLETSVQHFEAEITHMDLAPLVKPDGYTGAEEDSDDTDENEIKLENIASDNDPDPDYDLNDDVFDTKAGKNLDDAIECDENTKLVDRLEENPTKSDAQSIQYECSDCQTTFTARSSLVRHIKRGHSKVEKTCNKSSENRRNCNQCDKSFVSTERLKAHMQIVHEGKELFKCEVCQKSYSSRGSLKTHMIIHCDVRPFICNFCGRGFNSRYGLDEHMHTHSDDRPFPCEICDKTFKQKRLLIAHTRVHTRERPYKCKEEGCDRAYINGIDLKRHRYSKHGIFTKKHNCHICSRIFPEKKLLRKHLESH